MKTKTATDERAAADYFRALDAMLAAYDAKAQAGLEYHSAKLSDLCDDFHVSCCRAKWRQATNAYKWRIRYAREKRRQFKNAGKGLYDAIAAVEGIVKHCNTLTAGQPAERNGAV